MPISSSTTLAFGAIGSPFSALTPALSARKPSPLSSARALNIASAIGLRHTFAVQTKRIFFVWSAAALLSLNYHLPIYPTALLDATHDRFLVRAFPLLASSL